MKSILLAAMAVLGIGGMAEAATVKTLSFSANPVTRYTEMNGSLPTVVEPFRALHLAYELDYDFNVQGDPDSHIGLDCIVLGSSLSGPDFLSIALTVQALTNEWGLGFGSGRAQGEYLITDPDILDLYRGDTPALAVFSTNAVGGNIFADASVTLTFYETLPSVPLPASGLLLIPAFGLFLRRKRCA